MYSRYAVVVFALVGLAGCESLMPSQKEDPVALKVAELERRLVTIERIMENQSLVQLSQQVDALERRSDQLQGRAEEIEYNAEDTAARQRNLYADLDSRIQALERNLHSREGVLASGQLPPGELPIPGGTDRDNYQAAFELVKEERYDLAAEAFARFLRTFPDSELSDNAQYWLAESHYAAQRFEKALAEFTVVISEYPRSRKIPDALLKMGYCNYNLQRWNDARATLSRVICASGLWL